MRRSLSLIGGAALSGALALCVAIPAGAARESEKQPRVVGGNVANYGDWPFVAAIYFDGQQGCGGTVISPTAVLTAAHCAAGMHPDEMSVGTGRGVLSDQGSGETIGVADYSIHPGYRHGGRADFAVLFLERPTNAPVAALAAPESDGAMTAPGSVLHVAGWGATTPKGYDPGSDVLLETHEISENRRACKRPYRGGFKNRDQICTNGPRIGFGQNASSCFGDSGGPLMADTAAGRTLVGVVSFGGMRCGDPRHPSVYARVAPYADWINATAAAG